MLPYVELPDEGATAPPQVEVDIVGPEGVAEGCICLLDSGASFSVLPLDEVEGLGIDRSQLEPRSIRTANGWRDVLQLPTSRLLTVRLDHEAEIPIAPFVFPPEVIDEEEFASDYYVLGRDLFLSLEVTFRQQAEQVVLRPA